MAKPQQSYPTTATLGDHEDATDREGRAALEQALSEHGDELAALVGSSDELDDVLTTAILVAASADEDEVQYVTDSAANLVEAAEGLSTEGAASLATELGENADELGESLSTLVALQREGHVDDLATVATALTESLSPEEIDELSALLEESGADLVDALDLVLDLQREGDLEALVDTAQTLSALDLDPEAVDGINSLVGAVGDAQRESEPMGLLGAVSALRSADARAGLGYLVTVLRTLGRRVRRR
ncbi:DUF1641 domain-containing protein [Haloarcula onubensis]|uniref:DUF1641 domain-containing protein n=1 Tax=Haloarcula onubensis TaxID=2950539 RepID=A0ABU2FJ07_9EURY|nr:DUF1641 domain-containing protein [Halomicroarcula sp. S3CR25-11]MDS0280738.1 DUF1641 domain-containing protein [Halomicroarcula sp. S3CR25-11]